MIGLDDRRKELERTLSATPAPDPIRFHPKMAATFKLRVKALIAQLGLSEDALEAKEALRSLIERITLTPDQETGKLSVFLEGGLAALLQLSMGQTPTAPLDGLQGIESIAEFFLVAGVGFEPTTFRL
jgi:site-specific DNA recombinase